MKLHRLYHTIRLRLCKSDARRAQYIKKHNLLGAIGDNCLWGPRKLPLYPKLIKLHNNVIVHKNASIIQHDDVNKFLKRAYPEMDFGHYEKIGCVELMDNVFLATKVIVMPDVKINKNCMISAGSVVTSDIPENTIAAGVPAVPVGRFDMFAAFRKMGASQNKPFKNQALSEDRAEEEWKQFELKHK